jgi:CheY-like chemotaxis protein
MAKILVVDDQEKIRNLVSDLLRKEGYEVSNADSGEKCIEYLEKEIPDLIFLDLVMTGIDGLETLKRIKETYRDLPVVMLTSSDNIEDIVDAIK